MVVAQHRRQGDGWCGGGASGGGGSYKEMSGEPYRQFHNKTNGCQANTVHTWFYHVKNAKQTLMHRTLP